MEYRSGLGYDIHPTDPSRPLILGGVEVPSEFGLAGHSDADVLTHAIIDALLGAAGLGDIGQHFPDTDPAYRGISSLRLLEQVMGMLREGGARVVNVDALIVAEQPKLWPHFPTMKRSLAEVLGIEQERINLKATTNEGFDSIGRSEAIACFATCTIALAEERPWGGKEKPWRERLTRAKDLLERNELEREADLLILREAGRLIVKVDGGSKGNPGPAAAAAVISDPEGLAEYPLTRFLGEMTNNQAEYEAVILALSFLIEQGLSDRPVELYVDSELVARQLLGKYRVRDKKLIPRWQRARELMEKFAKLTLAHIPRTENRLADELVRVTIRRKLKGRS